MEIKKAPVIIIGSGIAGLLTALKLSASGIASIVVTKSRLSDNSSRMAQGGIAAVLPENTADSLDLHIKDTLYAGAGLSDDTVTRSILGEGYLAIEDLLVLGVPFDRVGGQLAFTKEAAHTTQRILHAGGDATGRSIQDTLIDKTQQDPNIQVFEECIALRLLVYNNRCSGVHVVSYEDVENPLPMLLLGQHTVLASGGIGQLYAQTTNPPIATGDGIALAYLAGARVQDMEFVQFHPTAFWHDGSVRFLISEALRGEGAILRDKAGRAFAKDYHPQGELAPRDVVTRAIRAQIDKDARPHVMLDITHLPTDTLETRFPNILQACLQYGVDIRKDWIPVAPAAHYGMGGIQVDAHGQTSIQNLHAVGEVVSTGLHGANRLASNSLLECVVLARRVAARVEAFSEVLPADILDRLPAFYPCNMQYTPSEALAQAIQALRDTMWQHVGILRDAKGLQQALAQLEQLDALVEGNGIFTPIPYGVELRNMLITSRLICLAALQREESRGAHFRTDFPSLSPHPRRSIQQMTLKTEAIRG